MLKATGIENEEFLEYKGRPLVRQGDDIYYGDLNDKHYVFMMIMSDKKIADETVPDMIMIQLIDSSTKQPKNQTTVKGLAEALEYADAWLNRFNK